MNLPTCISVFGLVLTAHAANYSLPTHRAYDWANNTGVVGGIPTITTLHSNVVAAGADNTGSVNASAIIQAALNNCPSNAYVYLPAGVYLLNNQLSIPGNGAVLRGAGMEQTILRCNFAAYCISVDENVTPAQRTNILAHVVKGDTNLWISSTHADIAVGRKLTVMYARNPQPLVWNPSGGISATNNMFRMQFLIKGTSGNNVWIDPAPFDCLTNNSVLISSVATRVIPPQLKVGIEGLHITNYSGTMLGGIQAFDQHDFWVSDVRVSSPVTSSGGINLVDCTRSTVRNCYISRRSGEDDVDGIGVSGGSSVAAGSQGVLIENCATDGMWPGIQLGENGGCVGNAVLYCYIVNPYVSTASDWIASSIASHGGHSGMNLIEGNICEGFVQLDGFHSSASHWTFFKNWFKGASGESGKVARRWTMDLTHYSYTNSIIRNVLGVSGYSWTLATTNEGFAYDAFNLIYRLGYPAMGNQNYSGVIPTTASVTNYGALDLNVTNSVILHGNYDYANAGFVYESGESTTFDDSLYYTVKPSYFGNLAWPRDAMEVTNRIPAMAFIDGDWSFTNAATGSRGIPLRGIRLRP